MRYSCSLAFLLIFFYNNLICIGQFTIIPTNTTVSLAHVFKKDNFYLIGGGDSFLAYCKDDCDSLTFLESPNLSGYVQRDIQLIDSNTFYASSIRQQGINQSLLFKTTDRGNNWTKILDTSGVNYSCFFGFDTTSASVVFRPNTSIYTTDGGATWHPSYHGNIVITASKKINDSTAIMGRLERSIFTTNKGQSWQSRSFVQSNPRGYYAKTLDSIYAVASGATGIFFSHNFDYPNTFWTNKALPPFSPQGVYAKSIDEVYVVGSVGVSNPQCRIMKTSDLGETWQFVDPGRSGSLFDIVFINETEALITGSGGLLLKWDSSAPMDGTLGVSEEIAEEKEIIKTYDLTGREVGRNTKNQVVIHVYSDGSTQKVFNYGD